MNVGRACGPLVAFSDPDRDLVSLPCVPNIDAVTEDHRICGNASGEEHSPSLLTEVLEERVSFGGARALLPANVTIDATLFAGGLRARM